MAAEPRRPGVRPTERSPQELAAALRELASETDEPAAAEPGQPRFRPRRRHAPKLRGGPDPLAAQRSGQPPAAQVRRAELALEASAAAAVLERVLDPPPPAPFRTTQTEAEPPPPTAHPAKTETEAEPTLPETTQLEPVPTPSALRELTRAPARPKEAEAPPPVVGEPLVDRPAAVAPEPRLRSYGHRPPASSGSVEAAGRGSHPPGSPPRRLVHSAWFPFAARVALAAAAAALIIVVITSSLGGGSGRSARGAGAIKPASTTIPAPAAPTPVRHRHRRPARTAHTRAHRTTAAQRRVRAAAQRRARARRAKALRARRR